LPSVSAKVAFDNSLRDTSLDLGRREEADKENKCEGKEKRGNEMGGIER